MIYSVRTADETDIGPFTYDDKASKLDERNSNNINTQSNGKKYDMNVLDGNHKRKQ